MLRHSATKHKKVNITRVASIGLPSLAEPIATVQVGELRRVLAAMIDLAISPVTGGEAVFDTCAIHFRQSKVGGAQCNGQRQINQLELILFDG